MIFEIRLTLNITSESEFRVLVIFIVELIDIR